MRISDWSSDVCSSDLGIAALFEHARRCAAEAGIDLQDLKTGGGSDGNFTAALGVPTLDGLGVDGMGGHTEYEQLYYSSLEPRAIGRASGRERVCQYVSIPVVAASLTKKKRVKLHKHNKRYNK